MQESIKFSLVICTFNDGIYVENALQSVFKQTYTTWELIIIDDGSSDDTQDRLKKYRNHPSLILIRNDENKGKSSCLNQALERVSGTWLIELDADDWLEENCLKRLSQDVINDHDTAMIYGWYLEWVERHRDKKLFRGRLVKNELSNNFTRYIENPVPLAPRVYHTDTLRREGGWDTKDIFQGRYFEDVYMICVLLKAEYKIRIIKETLYHRRLRKGSISDNKTEKYLIWKESMYKKMGIKKE